MELRIGPTSPSDTHFGRPSMTWLPMNMTLEMNGGDDELYPCSVRSVGLPC